MTPALDKARIIVAGAGVFGSSIALTLAQAGAQVVLADPAAQGDNASGVAAGMLAPAFEAVLDGPMAGRFDLLRAARDLWPEFAAGLGDVDIGLRRSGALWLAGDDLDAREQALRAIGATTRRLSPAQVRQRVPGAPSGQGGVYTGDDWRLSPGPALAALQAAARRLGVGSVAQSVTGLDGGVAQLSDGRLIPADGLVLATGADRSALVPELCGLQPIKGHILHYPAQGDRDGPTVRCAGGYIVGGSDGLHVGATMEAGLSDRAIDPAAVARLRAMGEGLFPALAALTPVARAAVRAATADGLPLVGPSARPGVYLAVGARRNGWLLAPLVARMTAAYLAGSDPGPHAPLFDSRRFAAV